MTITKVPLSSIRNQPGGIVGMNAAGRADVPPESVVRLWDFLDSAERAQLLTGGTTHNLLPKLQAAIASAVQPGTFVYPVAGIVELPRGEIYCASTLTLSASVHLRGHGAGQNGGNYATVLKFPADCAGVVINKGNVPNINGADGTMIDGVYIRGGGGTDRTKHGVTMLGRAKLRDCTVTHFPGHGGCAVADVASGSNANLWALDTCTLSTNGRSGFHAQGGDANAGAATMCDFSNNNEWGVDDYSFLGNTYTACHTDGNGRLSMAFHLGNRYYVKDAAKASTTEPGTDATAWTLIGPGTLHPPYYPQWVSGNPYVLGGAFRSAGLNARNTFIGCYSEAGSQPPSHFESQVCVVIGGIHAAGWTGLPTYIGDGIITRFRTEATAAGQYIQFGRGASGDMSTVLSFHDPSSAGVYPYRLQYEPGQHKLSWGNVANHLAMFNRDSTPANGFARDLSAGNGGIGFPNGYYMGAKALVKVTPGTAAPTTGTHNRGDRVENTTPSAGGFAGWICTTAGTPGTWKGFGAIEA